MSHSIVLGLGNPLLDITAVVPQAFLDKYDLKLNASCLAKPEHVPMFEELKEKFDPSYVPGGACQNTIRGVQFVLKTPQSSAFVGCVGNDDFGRIQRNLCAEAGVNVNYQVHPTAHTGTCAALVKDNERSLCANLAAANLFDGEYMKTPVVQDLIEHATYFYVEGFFLMVSMPAIRLLAHHATEQQQAGHKKLFMLNISASWVAGANTEQIRELMPYIDILFGNDDEAKALAKALGFAETSDLNTIISELVRQPKMGPTKRMVVITQGHQPCLVAGDGLEGGRVMSYEGHSIPAAEIVDTNGAGDSFVAGFVAELTKGSDVESCVNAGHALAALKLHHRGCAWK